MQSVRTDVSNRALLVRAGGQTCALELSSVVEIMRPLPVRAIAGAPAVVRGLAVIRGIPPPVVALDKVVLPAEIAAPVSRFVVVRTGARQVALAVEGVLGVYEPGSSPPGALPPLVQHAAGEAIDAIGALDSELLMVLNASRIVPDEVWDWLRGPEP